MAAPTIAQLRAAAVAVINAGSFGVTATETYLGIRNIESLETLRVEVLAGGVDADAESDVSAELRRRVIVLVRQRVDPESVSAIDTVYQLAESIGVHLLNTPVAVSAGAVGLEIEPIDEESLIEGIAEAAAVVTYLVPGA